MLSRGVVSERSDLGSFIVMIGLVHWLVVNTCEIRCCYIDIVQTL